MPSDHPGGPWELQITDEPEAEVGDRLGRALLGFNAELLGSPDIRPIAVLIRGPDGRVSGGLWGRTGFGWLHVELLFVPEGLRSQGLGGTILRMAEAEALVRGCVGAWLDTLSARARRFYEVEGYQVFGQLDDYPHGNGRYFLHKRFDRLQ